MWHGTTVPSTSIGLPQDYWPASCGLLLNQKLTCICKTFSNIQRGGVCLLKQTHQSLQSNRQTQCSTCFGMVRHWILLWDRRAWGCGNAKTLGKTVTVASDTELLWYCTDQYAEMSHTENRFGCSPRSSLNKGRGTVQIRLVCCIEEVRYGSHRLAEVAWPTAS